jgi:hypothetical protein
LPANAAHVTAKKRIAVKKTSLPFCWKENTQRAWLLPMRLTSHVAVPP